MREILFRGKQENNEWAEGSLIIWEDGSCLIETGKLTEPMACVNRETVGQFTGLTDKNGKKIFEGDIIECWSEGVKARGTVQQRCDGLWIIYPAWQKTIMWGLCPYNDGTTTCKVIGNIHDNPELLEVGNEN